MRSIICLLSGFSPYGLGPISHIAKERSMAELLAILAATIAAATAAAAIRAPAPAPVKVKPRR
jgi:hypothetical protein